MIRLCDRHDPPVRLESGQRCPECARERERHRPTRQARGYDAEHLRARAALAETLPAQCHYCPRLVIPVEPWVAAHLRDGDPSSPRVAAHRGCNERAKVRR